MTERPILFSAPMVRALLAGTKTQTRRIVTPMPGKQREWLTPEGINNSPSLRLAAAGGRLGAQMEHPRGGPLGWVGCPYGQPGDALYVRETFHLPAEYDDTKPKLVRNDAPVWFDADGRAEEGWGKTRVSIHMPRWASRLTLRITDVRVERLNDCSEADARAEGVMAHAAGWIPTKDKPGHLYSAAVLAYQNLWLSINGPDSWSANPWVWAVSFERVQP